ncbi:MAG: DUF2226 domain-containing protein [Candidatus Diapherotrites archaeon]|nr:DUF2226 domain-containing protein [Candidatus Diapherotrites archaeon]
MDLPLGTSLRAGLKTAESNMFQILVQMLSKGFTGYVVCTAEGPKGIEQGVLLFKKGAVLGSYFEFVSHAIEVNGDPSLRLVLNSFLAKNGIIDINALTIQQIDLITAFQEKILITEEVDTKKLNRLYPKKYSEEFTLEYIKGESEEASRFDIFKQTGLLGVEEK